MTFLYFIYPFNNPWKNVWIAVVYLQHTVSRLYELYKPSLSNRSCKNPARFNTIGCDWCTNVQEQHKKRTGQGLINQRVQRHLHTSWNCIDFVHSRLNMATFEAEISERAVYFWSKQFKNWKRSGQVRNEMVKLSNIAAVSVTFSWCIFHPSFLKVSQCKESPRWL